MHRLQRTVPPLNVSPAVGDWLAVGLYRKINCTALAVKRIGMRVNSDEPRSLATSWFLLRFCYVLLLVQVLSSCSDWRPFGHNRHGPKGGWAAVPFSVGKLGPHLTQFLPGPRPTSVPSGIWSIQPFGHNTPALQTGQRSRGRGRTVTCNGRPLSLASWSRQWQCSSAAQVYEE